MAAAAVYITKIDQAEMTPAEQEASNVRAAVAAAAVADLSAAQREWVFEPGYDPATVKPPRDY